MTTKAGVKLLKEAFPEYCIIEFAYGRFWGYKDEYYGELSNPEKII